MSLIDRCQSRQVSILTAVHHMMKNVHHMTTVNYVTKVHHMTSVNHMGVQHMTCVWHMSITYLLSLGWTSMPLSRFLRVLPLSYLNSSCHGNSWVALVEPWRQKENTVTSHYISSVYCINFNEVYILANQNYLTDIVMDLEIIKCELTLENRNI